MYLHARTCLRAYATTLFRRPFRIRRWLAVLAFSAVFWVLWVVLAFGRLLDHVLCPGFRRQPVEAPIFIIAHPRSGTTFLQRLMALDERRFVSARLWETVLPCVVYQRLIAGIGRIDARCGRPLAWLCGRIGELLLRGSDVVHVMRLDMVEEDEACFVHTFVSQAIYFLFPWIDELPDAGFADRLPERPRQKVFRYYRSCLQRQLHASGRNRTLLAKNANMAGRIESLRETFPDARFLSIVRHPYESIPSYLSMFHQVWRVHSPEIDERSRECTALAELTVAWYRHLLANREKIPADRYLTIRYEDLVESPRQTVETIYRHFGLEMDDDFAARLDAATRRSRTHRSAHRYSLPQYGLSEAWVRERLGDVFEACSLGA